MLNVKKSFGRIYNAHSPASLYVYMPSPQNYTPSVYRIVSTGFHEFGKRLLSRAAPLWI